MLDRLEFALRTLGGMKNDRLLLQDGGDCYPSKHLRNLVAEGEPDYTGSG